MSRNFTRTDSADFDASESSSGMPAFRITFLTMVTVLADEAEEEYEESDDDADDANVAAALLAAAAAAAAAADWRCDADGARPAARYQAAAPIAAAPTAATAATAHALSARLKEDDAGLFALLDDDDGADEWLPLDAAPALGFDMARQNSKSD